MDLSGRIAQANGRLRAANLRVKIDQEGDRLRLRATLPPKPGSQRKDFYQQRICLGILANPLGLKEAEKEARKVGALLDCGEFDWLPYLSSSTSKAESIGDWIERLEAAYLGNGGTIDTWQGDYLKAFKKLDYSQPLEPGYLERVILSTAPNSKTRRRVCMAYQKLAEVAGTGVKFSHMAGKYSPSSVEPRNLPTDEQIAEYFYSLKHPGWQWIYGMMATYGLRNHEVFHLDLGQFPVIRVLKTTKTGEHEVWPCYPEWANEFDLANPKPTGVNLNRANQKIGNSVTDYLSPKLPFVPYDLRHCWAIRTSIFGWPVELAAHQMGHSLSEHTRTYQRWITGQHQQRVFDLLVNRIDRPLPPAISPASADAKGM